MTSDTQTNLQKEKNVNVTTEDQIDVSDRQKKQLSS